MQARARWTSLSVTLLLGTELPSRGHFATLHVPINTEIKRDLGAKQKSREPLNGVKLQGEFRKLMGHRVSPNSCSLLLVFS